MDEEYTFSEDLTKIVIVRATHYDADMEQKEVVIAKPGSLNLPRTLALSKEAIEAKMKKEVAIY